MKKELLNQYISLIDELVEYHKHIFSEEQMTLLQSLKTELKNNKKKEDIIEVFDIIMKVIIAGTNFFK